MSSSQLSVSARPLPAAPSFSCTVPGGLGGSLYTQSLAYLVTKCEDLFMGGQKKELSFKENWSLFKLTCSEPCCDLGNAIWYYTAYSEATGNTLL